MVIERSHGKARPTLPRASDLTPAEAEAKPKGCRGPHGRYANGDMRINRCLDCEVPR